MNKEESLALFKKGKEAWNVWAEEMLAQRRAWAEDGTWPEGQYPPDDNDTIVQWCETTSVDFDNHIFRADANFRGYLFPCSASFQRATFQQIADFRTAKFFDAAILTNVKFTNDAKFEAAIFHGLVSFNCTEFNGAADFEDVKFFELAIFEKVTVSNKAWFNGSKFDGVAHFSNANFAGSASFSSANFLARVNLENASFLGSTDFESVKFAGHAIFENSSFSSKVVFDSTVFFQNADFESSIFLAGAYYGNAEFMDVADFQTSTFKGSAFFDGAKFNGWTSFRAVKSERAFSLTGCVFRSVPEFSQISFDEAPRMDNFRIEAQRFVRTKRFLAGISSLPIFIRSTYQKMAASLRKWFGTPLMEDEKLYNEIRTNDEAAKFRALQRLAQNSHNYSLEQKFFREELKSRQFREDWPWRPRFVFAVFYEVLSDFGRSIVRPLGWLIVSMLLFAGGYLALGNNTEISYWQSTGSTTQQAVGAIVDHLGFSEAIEAPTGAICVSGNPGDPFVSALALSGRNSLPFAAGAFTETNRQAQACLYGTHKVAGREQPKVPVEVVMLGAAQTIVSLILLFLFGLALRNHFKIK